MRWDLETCFNYAKANNVTLRGSRLDLQNSQQQLTLAKANVLPDLYGSATQYLNHTNQQSGQAVDNYKSALTGSGSYELSSSWTLYRGGYLKTDIAQRNLDVSKTNLTLMEQQNDVTVEITQYYLNILLEKEQVVYQQNLVSSTQVQVDRAQLRLKAGSIASKDLLQLQAQLANDRYSLINAQNAERQDLLSLKQLLQLPPEIALDIQIPAALVPVQETANVDSVQKVAEQQRPEVQRTKLAVKLAELDLRKAYSGYRPSLTASGFAGTSFSGKSPSYFNQLNHGFNQQIGLTLSVPLFTRKTNSVNVAIAKIDIEHAKLNLQDTRLALATNIEKAHLNVINAQSQYLAAAEAFEYNKETYRIANEQLRLGVFNMVDFLEQKTLYVQALQQFLQAKYNAVLTTAIYHFYKGEPIKL